MEDSHTHILSLAEDREASFFAVYDGHGGAKVAQYAAKNLHKKICLHPLYKKGLIEDAIRLSFLDLDSDMLNDDNMRDELAGTTAITVLIKNNKIYCVRIHLFITFLKIFFYIYFKTYLICVLLLL
jgi:protein phosphatase 2C family protein 2/3